MSNHFLLSTPELRPVRCLKAVPLDAAGWGWSQKDRARDFQPLQLPISRWKRELESGL